MGEHTEVYRGALKMRRIPGATQLGSMSIDRTRAMWPQIAAIVLERIHSGAYPPGSKIPSVVQLANEFGVVNSTAQRAMEAVKKEGLTRSEAGMGTFVLRPEEREAQGGKSAD